VANHITAVGSGLLCQNHSPGFGTANQAPATPCLASRGAHSPEIGFGTPVWNARCTVAIPTPRVAAMARHDFPSVRSSRMLARLNTALGLPIAAPLLVPCAFACSSPATMRSRMTLRSKSAMAPMIVNMALPIGVLVSKASCALTKSIPGLSVKQVAELLGCSPSHLRYLLNGNVPDAPRIPHVRAGRVHLIRRVVVLAWLETLKQVTTARRGTVVRRPVR
jgi:excisionase family DNA binding protein